MKKSNFLFALYIIILLGSIFLFLNACALHPIAWKPEPKPLFTGQLALNEKLHSTQKIPLNGWFGPEDILFDSLGNMFCGVHISEHDFSDGRILKIDSTGKIEEYLNTHSWVAGLHFDKSGNLIALSHKQGLIRISPEKKVEVLANKDENNLPFLIPNGLDVASDGKIYFSNTSNKSSYNERFGKKLILEMLPDGGLYCYDPITHKVKTLINGTYFGNGVVLSKNEDYLLMTETERYRVLRYWLKGEMSGKTDIFMDNLPGFPNGISIRNDGTYWLGFSTKRNDALDNIHPKPFMKKLVYGLPNFLQPKQDLFGMVLNVSPDGKVIKAFFDTTGAFVPQTGAVKENNRTLYFGGDSMPYVGKYKLD